VVGLKIVFITLIPLDNSSMVAITRLLRIFRVLRLLTSRPQLKNIIDMLIGAIPAIIDIVILLKIGQMLCMKVWKFILGHGFILYHL